jgi:putative Mg2+ transporter-C (MgtC) family protein
MNAFDSLAAYWSAGELLANGLILLHLIGALLLGLLVGYERAYHGRAAGMRTYGLVCMSSAALTILAGYSQFWYGANTGQIAAIDPTRIIQGVVTGIGFLGAGVIVREGFTISGLTTAASIWGSSVIGILVGIGFYPAAMGLAFLSSMIMIYLSRLEVVLPSRHAVAVRMRFKPEYLPSEAGIRELALARGYEIAGSSLTISSDAGRQEWRFVALALSRKSGAPLSELARELGAFDGVEAFQLSRARN